MQNLHDANELSANGEGDSAPGRHLPMVILLPVGLDSARCFTSVSSSLMHTWDAVCTCTSDGNLGTG